MRIDSASPRVPCSCDGGPAAARPLEALRAAAAAKRADRVTLTGGAPGAPAGVPPAPTDAQPSLRDGEPTDPEVAGRAGASRDRLVAQYRAILADPAGPARVEAYG